jgi:two-component system LytT family response regulator
VKALIVDDERIARAELRRLLAAHPEIEIVGEAANVDDARAAVEQLQPEIVFLDIELPGGSGFDLLASLDDPPAVIFTTAYDQYAVQAFTVEAVDYLVKPVDPRRLAAAIERLPRVVVGKYLDRIFVKDGERCYFVTLREVPIIESAGNYAMLHLERARPMLSRSLAYLENRLDPEVFFRASRSHLVNLAFITHVEPGEGGGLVLRVGATEVEMSRRQAQRFRERMTP